MNASTRLSVQKSEAMVQIVGKQPLGNIDTGNEIGKRQIQSTPIQIILELFAQKNQGLNPSIRF